MVHKLSEIEHRASFGKEHLQGQVESSPSPAYLTSERERAMTLARGEVR